MVYGVLSDVHSNLEGLRLVLERMADLGARRVLFLGDAVGYGADPNACVRLLAQAAEVRIRGNHDRVVGAADGAGGATDGYAYSSDEVRVADQLNFDLMEPDCLAWIRELPPGPVVVDGELLLCHGTPEDEDEYLVSWEAAAAAHAHVRERFPGVRVCFFGHTHIATVIQDGRRAKGGAVDLDPDSLYLVNPGSVGQPRDGDPRASFGILDTGGRTYRNHRVAYDTGEAQRKIIRAGLPRVFADRLRVGR